jgi:Aromatic amino acid lyase
MSKAVSIGGARAALGVEDVVGIAYKLVSVELDEKNLGRIRKESPKPNTFAGEEVPPRRQTPDVLGTAPEVLSRERTRIALCCVLLRLAAGSSGVRDAVLSGLAALINKAEPTLRKTATDAQALSLLCAFFHGDANALCLTDADTTAVLGDTPPSLSSDERLQLTAGLPVTTGLMALAVVQLRSLLSTCTAALALSCEALRASTKPFDPKAVEAGQNKAAIAASAEVLALLEGSTQTNAKAKDGGAGDLPEIVQARLPRACSYHRVTCACACARPRFTRSLRARCRPCTCTYTCTPSSAYQRI